MSKIARLADSHIHLFADGYKGGKYGPLFPKGGEVRTYEAIRGVHNVERALVVGYEGDPWCAGNNKYIAGLAKQHPWITPLAWQAPAGDVFPKALQALWKAGFKGIALYLFAEADIQAALAWPEETFAVLNEKRALISFNVPQNLIRPLRPFLQRLPQTTVLFSHMGLPGRIGPKTSEASARKALAPLLAQADLPHVGVKLSGFYDSSAYPHPGMAPVLQAVASSFGAKRLYWGSDFAPALDTVTFGQTIDAAVIPVLKAAEQKAVFADNLIRAMESVR